MTKYEEGLTFDSKSNPKRFWKHDSAQKPGRHSVMELLVKDTTVSTPKDIAAELSSQFKLRFTPQDNVPCQKQKGNHIEEPMQKVTGCLKCGELTEAT